MLLTNTLPFTSRAIYYLPYPELFGTCYHFCKQNELFIFEIETFNSSVLQFHECDSKKFEQVLGL